MLLEVGNDQAKNDYVNEMHNFSVCLVGEGLLTQLQLPPHISPFYLRAQRHVAVAINTIQNDTNYTAEEQSEGERANEKVDRRGWRDGC